MNKPLITVSDMQALIKRRKTLAVAAAVGVAGCSMLGPQLTDRSPDAAGNAVADEMVKGYTTDIEKALDQVDRKRLDAARQAGQASRTDSTKPPEMLRPVAAPLDEKQVAGAKPVLDSKVVAHAAAADHSAAPAAGAGHETAETVQEVPPVKAPDAPAGDKVIAKASTPAVDELAVKESHAAPAEKPAAVAESPAKPPLATASPMNSLAITAEDAAPATPVVKTTTPPSAMGTMAMVGATAGHNDIAEHAVSAEPSLDDALAVLRKSIGTHPTLNTALALALLDGSKSPDNDMSKMLSESDQKVLTDLVAALDSMKSTPASPSAAVSQRAAPLVDAAKKWEADAALALPCLSLATRVDSYGVFTAVTPTFEQGRRHTVIIYCEVANFGSKKGEDGWYTTKLTQQESLITEDKLLVWRPNAEEVEDRSLNQRHDFYLVKKLTLAENLAAGKYKLRMDVTDTISGKRAMQELDIQIVAK